MPADERPAVGREEEDVAREGARVVELRLGCGRAVAAGVRTVRLIVLPVETSRGDRVPVASVGRVGRYRLALLLVRGV